jgi:hypothetical protein
MKSNKNAVRVPFHLKRRSFNLGRIVGATSGSEHFASLIHKKDGCNGNRANNGRQCAGALQNTHSIKHDREDDDYWGSDDQSGLCVSHV